MAEGTAKVKTLDYKKASQNVKTLVDNKGNVVMTIPLPEKSKYLVITIPSESVDKKLESLQKAGLDDKEKTKELMKWINENKNVAVKKYLETKNESLDFELTFIKGAEITPVKPAKADVDIYALMASKSIEEKQIKAPDSMKIGSTKEATSSSGKKASESVKKADYVLTTKWVEKSKTFKNFGQILGTYYEGKEPGTGAAYSHTSVPIVWELEGKTTKLNFFIVITTSDFGNIDISNMTKKQREKAVDTITDNLLKNIAEAFKEKGIKLKADAIKEGFKNVVTGLVDNIAQEKKKVIILK